MMDDSTDILDRALEHGANLTPKERFQRLVDIGLINEEVR